jgi:hypothetical protein
VTPLANLQLSAYDRISGTHTMQGLKQEPSTSSVIAGHAFVQNRRRGHYELAVDEPVTRRVAVAVSELASAI